jgi:hypothetical protein
MSRFIKLTDMVLNTHNITKILIKPSKYHIVINDVKQGGSLWLVAGSGFGSIDTNSTIYTTICKKENPEDYKNISNWIESATHTPPNL